MRRYICLFSTKTERQRDNHEDDGQFDDLGAKREDVENCSVLRVLNFFFSSLCALCSCLLNIRTHALTLHRLSATTKRRVESVWALRRYRAGWLGKRARFHRRKSPSCGLFSATTSSSAQMVVDDAKDPRRDDALYWRKPSPTHRWQSPRLCW